MKLRAEWNAAMNAYAKNFQVLMTESGKIPMQHYEELRESTEAAREVSERMGKAMDLHILTHRC
jgi:ferric iron reductase protein FhuF